jgi:transcriptional regulator with XRE-family HTH domain
MIVGKRLKEARVKKGMSQEELGNLLGVSKVSICGYEKGTRTPTMENFLDLIQILELEPDYVLGRDKTVVSETKREYKLKMADEDIQFVNAIKDYRELYNFICNDPKRAAELINRKIMK